ncbi:hypothetical protein E2C01_040884 [Portunus trituberculatus]|uniref:Uncharacterized protein n=1 Tax=Portunus trituberculatus TaxID=210409 RepID=A0A5B7FQF1_PORTR|nr:hypothetical protein [Portunus trituberculatus]
MLGGSFKVVRRTPTDTHDPSKGHLSLEGLRVNSGSLSHKLFERRPPRRSWKLINNTHLKNTQSLPSTADHCHFYK